MDNHNSNIIEVLKNSTVEGYTSYKLHIYPDITDEMISNAFKGLKLPLFYDEVLALFDMSILENCKSGLVFLESGFFTSRTLDSTYYVNYKDIEKCEIDKKSLNITLISGDTINICYSVDQAIYLQKVLCTLASRSRTWNLLENEKESGPIKDVKDLLSKKEINKCHMTIHSAAAACGSIGAAPHIPLSDSFIITPIQVGMLVSLSQIFGAKITRAAAQSILSSYISSTVGRSISQLMVGWIPGVGNVVNLVTAVSLTEFIGWSFAREYAENRKFNIRTNIFTGVKLKYFQDIISKLSDDNYKRFAKDISFFSSEDIKDERKKVEDEFYSVIAQCSEEYNIEISKIVFEYTKWLKNILKEMENVLINGSQARRYFDKFQKMEFDNENMDVDYFVDFVELFLGLYNSMISTCEDNSVNKFSFGIELENPDKFFYLLYINDSKERVHAIHNLREDGKLKFNSKKKRKNNISEKKLLKKKAIHALTSLAYCYAVDREEENDE